MEHKFTLENFEKEVLQSDIPVLVDYFADWCNPCKMMAPVIATLAEEYDGKIKIGKCDIQANMALAQKYRVVNIPTLMIFQNGEPVETMVGLMNADDLRDKLDEILA